MKSLKITAAVIGLSIALIGAGYAAWGSSITSSANLNSGIWSVVLEKDCVIAGDQVNQFTEKNGKYNESFMNLDYGKYDMQNPAYLSGAKPIRSTNYVYTLEPSVNSDKDIVTFNFYNLHPGTRAITNFSIRNMGSIPAKISNVTVDLPTVNSPGTTQNMIELMNAIKVDGTFYKRNGLSIFATKVGSFQGVPLMQLQDTLKGILVKDSLTLLAKESISTRRIDSSALEASELTFYIPAEALKAADGKNLGMLAAVPVSISFDFCQYNKQVAGR